MTRAVSNQRGLTELRRMTEYFIADDPTIISLIPHEKASDGAGGYALVPLAARAAQTFKLITIPASLDGLIDTEGGTSRNWNYVLLGKYDAEIEIGDTWTDGDTNYRVTSVMQANDYEKRAVVIAFGKDPNYG